MKYRVVVSKTETGKETNPGEVKAEQPLFIPERGWAMSKARQWAGLEKPRLALGTKWGHHIYAQHNYLPLLVTLQVPVLLSYLQEGFHTSQFWMRPQQFIIGNLVPEVGWSDCACFGEPQARGQEHTGKPGRPGLVKAYSRNFSAAPRHRRLQGLLPQGALCPIT